MVWGEGVVGGGMWVLNYFKFLYKIRYLNMLEYWDT